MLSRRHAIGLAVFGVLLSAGSAQAGGPEFPAGGTRSLGRGGAAFARADDPHVMTRNPALLADMWGDQAMLGAHLLLVDSCFWPTGAYGWGPTSNPPDVSIFDGKDPVLLTADMDDQYLDGRPLPAYQDEPFPEVCYQGPAPFLPQVGVTMKLAPDLGVGLGFFPPDGAGLNQWGNRDGTVDTPKGRRPNPLRFVRSNQTVSFFTLLGGVGYRLNDFIRLGAALQWNLAVFEATTWTTPQQARNTRNDVRTNVFGRDLFIPGLIASIDIKPIEALDIAVGYKWSDRVKGNAKLDITSGAFGTGETFTYISDPATGMRTTLGSAIPTTTPNQNGYVSAPPIWVPQLSFGIRFADRLRPLTDHSDKSKLAAGKFVEDSMATERWDIEADFIYYFNSEYNRSQFTTDSAGLSLSSVQPDGTITQFDSEVGKCIEPVMDPPPGVDPCPKKTHIVKTDFGGKNQISLRVGGDYNLFPGLFTMRAGFSYETDGQDVELLNVLTYMLERKGLHFGLTFRLFDKTDVSIGFAHFIQRDVRLQVQNQSMLPRKYKSPEYNFAPGEGVESADPAMPQPEGSFDGTAGLEVPNGDRARPLGMPGPHFINAGSYFYHLDVVSLTFAQHF
jgi:long-subunit fatty acid transport protein